MNDIEFSPESWRKAATGFSEVADDSSQMVSELVTATTDAAACGAAGGLSTVDGALTMMLQVFGQVMQENVITPYCEGVASEAEVMCATANDYVITEADNTSQAQSLQISP